MTDDNHSHENLETLAAKLPKGVEREELDAYAQFMVDVMHGKESTITDDIKEKVEGQKEQFPEVWGYIEEKMCVLRKGDFQ
ncbi:hypothetical protein COU77_02260 [Candidatus Peregrinibacteria bacterium CG10_big_fil_rev_8_21_14_0_10_49_16]|nr:MAG: hypothetical protein COU77_02260 [Candidatus Peregrinibacteria bacterium CG10_big_fil_rev_8_21_14_0_10_49_16]